MPKGQKKCVSDFDAWSQEKSQMKEKKIKYTGSKLRGYTDKHTLRR